MSFFAPELLDRRPEWLIGERGRDVATYLTWYPVVTFLHIAFDLPMATSVPDAYGHNLSPASYLDAWTEVTEPDPWTDGDTKRRKQRFAE